MALYEHKEFLNFADVADYLTDKGIYNFVISYEQDYKKLDEFIMNLFNENKIHPVFYYDGLVKDGFELDNKYFLMQGWIYASKKMVNSLQSKGKIDLNVKEYLKIYKLHSDTENSNIGEMIKFEMNNYIFMDTNRYKLELPKLDNDENIIEPKSRLDIIFEILDDFKKEKEKNPNLEIDLDNYKDKLPKIIKNDISLNFDDLLYPKSDLDKLFNQQPQTDNSELVQQLQATIDHLTAENQKQADTIQQLNERLEQQAAKPSDTPAGEPLKGIAKVNYDKDRAKAFARIVAKFVWNMDTTQQIKSGDMANQIYALLLNFNDGATPETTDTIKEWLAEITPDYAKQAGRPPKNQPTEIALTLKK